MTSWVTETTSFLAYDEWASAILRGKGGVEVVLQAIDTLRADPISHFWHSS